MHKVRSGAEMLRQVLFVLRLTEFVLGRPVRSVLDIGCGEGQWKLMLEKQRPSLSYTGVDPSEYVVSRFGAQRNILLGSVETLKELPLRESYDMVVCCGMLNYLSRKQLTDGLGQISVLTGGVAYLELFAREDQYEGDTDWAAPASAAWYRKALAGAGFCSVGMQCYVPLRYKHRLSSLEMC